MQKFQTKTFEIEAIQCTKDSWDEVEKFAGYCVIEPLFYRNGKIMGLMIQTEDSNNTIFHEDDWLAKDDRGYFHLFSDEDFKRIFEPIPAEGKNLQVFEPKAQHY
jgi:hypothetical protein